MPPAASVCKTVYTHLIGCFICLLSHRVDDLPSPSRQPIKALSKQQEVGIFRIFRANYPANRHSMTRQRIESPLPQGRYGAKFVETPLTD